MQIIEIQYLKSKEDFKKTYDSYIELVEVFNKGKIQNVNSSTGSRYELMHFNEAYRKRMTQITSIKNKS